MSKRDPLTPLEVAEEVSPEALYSWAANTYGLSRAEVIRILKGRGYTGFHPLSWWSYVAAIREDRGSVGERPRPANRRFEATLQKIERDAADRGLLQALQEVRDGVRPSFLESD